MNYLKFTSYAYILVAILFAVEAFTQYESGNTNKAILMVLFTVGSIFLYFFRRRFAQKFVDRNKKP
ncbi:MAG: hypothetical protein QM710_06610 [Flavobacterium sp.]